jgi:hypothetical protein
MRRWHGYALLVGLLALSLFGCSSDSSPGDAVGNEAGAMDFIGEVDLVLADATDMSQELDIAPDLPPDLPLELADETVDVAPETVDVVEVTLDVTPPCVDATQCEDGDFCSVDKCVDGECLHQDKNCGDGNKCTDDWCDPASGLCVHETAECDDGNSCSWDSCLPGTGCEHEPIPDCCPGDLQSVQGFEESVSWTVVPEFAPEESSATWQISTKRAHGGESSLYFGSLESGNYDFGGRLRVFAETMPFVLSANVASELRFWVWMNVEPSVNYDAFTVFVISEAGMVPVFGKEPMTQMKKWKSKLIDLKAFRGETIKFRFVFDSIDGNDNTYEGIYIDDFELWELCPDQGCVTKVECNDGQVCTQDTCVDGVCEYLFTDECCINLADCLDTDPCTIDACKDNICEPLAIAPPYCCYVEADCDDDNICTEDICSESGICLHPPSQAAGCCEVNADCDDGNPCTDNTCNPDDSSCYFPFNSSPCDDVDKCTKNDHCIEGSCGGDPVVCSDGNNCTTDLCHPQNGCYHPNIEQGEPCDDLNNCTVSDICLLGECAGEWIDGCCLKDVDCDDNDDCTIDKCTENECQNINTCCFSDEECNDFDDICTIDSCVDGDCVYAPTGVDGCCQGVIFRDDFSTDKGWQFDTEWERGSAQPSGGGSGNPDPSSDHTGSADNHIIGAVIGGNCAQTLHSFYWATSPVIDTQNASNLRLYFWRWLNSDYAPYMVNAVDVYNGSEWVRIWETGGPPGIVDSSWQFVSHDVTAYKNSNFQVRFGFMIGSGGVYSIGGWNVDDVVLFDMPTGDAPGACCDYDTDCVGIYPGAPTCVGGMCTLP